MHEHRACQPTPSKHHSHARCVHLEAAMPNEPHADDSSAIKHTDASSKDTPAPRDAKRSTVKRATTYLKHAGNTPHPRSPLASLTHFCTRNTQDHPSRGFCPRKQSLGTCKTGDGLSQACGQRPPSEITIGIPHAFLHEKHSGSPEQGVLPAQAFVRHVTATLCHGTVHRMPLLSHASTLYRQLMPRAYHGRSR